MSIRVLRSQVEGLEGGTFSTLTTVDLINSLCQQANSESTREGIRGSRSAESGNV